MGLSAIDYAINGPRRPGLLVVTDIDDARLKRASEIFPPEQAEKKGVTLHYVNTLSCEAIEKLKTLNNGKGYDDVFVFAPVEALIEQASRLLGFNGCLNFFAGPSRQDFFAPVNFCDIHYSGHHVVGSSGGNIDDMREALELMGRNVLNPAVMVTHVGGLDSAARTIMDLPSIPGGKKLIYTNVSMPLTAIHDFASVGRSDPMFAELARLTKNHNGLWSVEAENYLLANAAKLGPGSKC
jgi:threonine dehydrogenase-like Zn-dependent dehydrogenase